MTEELDLVVTRGPHPVHVRVRAGLKKSKNWRQLAKFCIVGGSGYVVNLLVFGWAIGLAVSGLVMRVGLGAEGFAWAAIFAIAPISAVYYPVSVLPHWLQAIAWTLPPAYVFEGMRSVVLEHRFHPDLLVSAMALNVVYFGAGSLAFLLFFRSARINGNLLQIGE